jgi:hypothetical protein
VLAPMVDLALPNVLMPTALSARCVASPVRRRLSCWVRSILRVVEAGTLHGQATAVAGLPLLLVLLVTWVMFVLMPVDGWGGSESHRSPPRPVSCKLVEEGTIQWEGTPLCPKPAVPVACTRDAQIRSSAVAGWATPRRSSWA